MESKSQYSSNQAAILVMAIETFGSKVIAEKWMNDHNLMLGGTPMAIAESDLGMQQVQKVLTAINYGGAA